MFLAIMVMAATTITIIIVIIPSIAGSSMAIILSMASRIGLVMRWLFLQNGHKLLKLTFIKPYTPRSWAHVDFNPKTMNLLHRRSINGGY